MIKNFVVYDEVTGKILCSAADPKPENFLVSGSKLLMDVSCNILDNYVLNDAIVPIPKNLDKNKVFNYLSKRWEDPRSIQDFKDAQWSLIKKAREDAISAPLTTPYGVFDSDEGSRKSITDAVLMLQTMSYMGTPTPIDFTLADNTVVALSTPQMVEVGLLLGQKTQAAYSQARIKRVEIEAATTKEQVVAVQW